MYRSIYDYAVAHELSLPKFRKEKQIKGYIRLSRAGEYEGFEKVPKEEVKRIWCPHITDSKPALICEKRQFIFPEEDANTTALAKYHGFMNMMNEGSEYSKTLKTIQLFLNRLEEEKEFADSIRKEMNDAGIKNVDYISFRIDSVNAEKQTDWADWFDGYAQAHSPKNTYEKIVISELTGKPVVPIIDKFPQNTAKAAGTGFPLYSNQHRKVSGEACSFVSYGCVNGIACPMSQEEAEAVNAGLKHLLDTDTNNDRDFGFLYWYDRNDAADLITNARMLRHRTSKKGVNEVEAEREKQYSYVLNAVFSGTKAPDIDDHGKYHIVEYNLPDKGRVSLSKEYFGTYRELYNALQKWYLDSSYTDVVWVNKKNSGTAVYTLGNIYAVLLQCLKHKGATDIQKELDIEYGRDKRGLAKAMLFGHKVPKVFLFAASEQITRSYVCKKQFEEEKRSRRILLQTIKVCLLREGYEDMKTTLNKDAGSIGYHCGRWFATMVRAQELSTNGKALNTSLSDRYYRAAKQAPARTLAMVNGLKEHYLNKMPAGSKIGMERTFAEISEKIGTAFPERFTILEQGAFDLGYAQQRQAFFMRPEKDLEQNTSEQAAHEE